MTPRTVRTGFVRSVEKFPDRPALEVDGRTWTYRELGKQAASIAATLHHHNLPDDPPLTGVFGLRSSAAFCGVLGALYNGHGYVPFNPQFPVERTRKMVERSGVRAIIVDATAAKQVVEVLSGNKDRLLLLLPEVDDVSMLRGQLPGHIVLGRSDLVGSEHYLERGVDPNILAYLLFTSGSTGMPKGVMVAHRNVTHFVDAMVERYKITEKDKFSQTFDLTFDLSAFDMFVAWERGACLCVPTLQQKSLPAQWINDAGLTVWFSVPSTAALMNKLRMLTPGKYPKLRWSLFCGEALPNDLVDKWQKAAPNSVVENLYGPTELTIACTLYRWDAARSPAESEQGVVPIGEPYPGMEVLVADEAFKEVPPGEAGELLMTGPQLSLGYWRDQEKTKAAFVVPPGKSATYYRTGDRVRRPAGKKPMTYLGRIDFQIKIQGYRVELGEIEAVAREAAGVDVAVAVGWPMSVSGAEGIVLFIAGPQRDTSAAMATLKARLPAYMAPSRIEIVPEFPLNSNGKVDRKALTQRLEVKKS